MKNASQPSKPKSLALPEKLQELLEQNDPAFAEALNAESAARAAAFLTGVKAYRNHPAMRDVPEAPVIWQEGTTRLRDYNPTAKQAPVILIIPSLINRFDILDLDFAPSFLRTLAASGFRPLVVDWDAPGPHEKNFSLDDYVERLTTITDWLGETISGFHLLGYCMGGLLALALATLRPDAVRTLSLLATPWDFHKPDPAAGSLVAGLADVWDGPAQTSMPVDIIQYMFALLQPFQGVNKFIDFAAMDQGSAEARQFVLTEDWLNDGVPLPIPVARTCLRDWYGANTTAALQWRCSGRIIDPHTLAMPCYVVVAGRDKVVPPESSLPLTKLLPHASLHEPMTGHIGLMASRNASHQVWKPLLHWLGEHS